MIYDVIIVGAGPAGSVCAYECSKGGLKTLLLDRDAFPRQKPCGGAVAEQALSYLDFPLPAGIIERDCYGAVVRFNGHQVDIRKDTRIAVLVSRDRFDAFLAEKAVDAGARFLSGEKVTGVALHGGSVDVRTAKASYTGSYLVGADGIHGIGARSVRPPLPKDEMALALVCSTPAPGAAGNEEQDGFLDMQFGIAPMGYGWDFPHAGYRSVGVMGLASAFSDPHAVLSEYAASRGVRPENVRGHFIPFGGIRRKVVSGRAVLAGDAAGFGDAFTGEGIVHAILSGKLAAHAIVNAVTGGSGPAALAAYEREADERIRKNLRHALFLARLIDRLPDLSVRIFFHNGKAMEKYLDIPAGRTDYRGFRKWLIRRLPFYLLSSLARSLFRR
jgi:geranylgeranyl reductase family protein